jgi:hypothetical protein
VASAGGSRLPSVIGHRVRVILVFERPLNLLGGEIPRFPVPFEGVNRTEGGHERERQDRAVELRKGSVECEHDEEHRRPHDEQEIRVGNLGFERREQTRKPDCDGEHEQRLPEDGTDGEAGQPLENRRETDNRVLHVGPREDCRQEKRRDTERERGLGGGFDERLDAYENDRETVEKECNGDQFR